MPQSHGDEDGDNIPRALLNVFVGCLSVYALLFGVGYLLYGHYVPAMILLLMGSVGVGILIRNIRKAR